MNLQPLHLGNGRYGGGQKSYQFGKISNNKATKGLQFTLLLFLPVSTPFPTPESMKQYRKLLVLVDTELLLCTAATWVSSHGFQRALLPAQKESEGRRRERKEWNTWLRLSLRQGTMSTQNQSITEMQTVNSFATKRKHSRESWSL